MRFDGAARGNQGVNRGDTKLSRFLKKELLAVGTGQRGHQGEAAIGGRCVGNDLADFDNR